jgi:hypothetical protein
MVKLEGNTYKLVPAKSVDHPPKKISQENVREVVLDLDEGEEDHPVPEGEDRLGNAVGARRLGMVLSHGCELDKKPEHPMVSMMQVRPLAPLPSEVQDGIRSYGQKRTFYLPPNDSLPEEHWVDFRFVTTIRRDVIDELPRIASMNEDGRDLLHYQLFRFYARKRLPDEFLEWSLESEEGQT